MTHFFFVIKFDNSRYLIKYIGNLSKLFNRHKLLEQQVYPGNSWATPNAPVNSRPPPPYPSVSPVSTSQSSFVFGPEARPERFAAPQPQVNIPIAEQRLRSPRTPSKFYELLVNRIRSSSKNV